MAVHKKNGNIKVMGIEHKASGIIHRTEELQDIFGLIRTISYRVKRASINHYCLFLSKSFSLQYLDLV